MECIWCNWDIDNNQVSKEHLMPKSRGGSNNDCNIAIACKNCNRVRKSKSVIDYVKLRAAKYNKIDNLDNLFLSLDDLSANGNKLEKKYANKQIKLINDYLSQYHNWGIL